MNNNISPEAILKALKDARDSISAWGDYASAYFQEKHDLAGDIEKIENLIAEMEKEK